MGVRKRDVAKDLIITIVIIGIGIYLWFAHLNGVQSTEVSDEVSSFISTIIVYILGLITLFDIGDMYGISFIVPNYYSNNKKKKQEKNIKNILNEYYVKEQTFIKSYSNDRIKYFMNQLGLTSEQFNDVKLEILNIQLMKAGTIDQIQNKLRKIIINQYVLIKSSDYKSTELMYDKVKYYINFMDIMYSPLGDDLACMLANFVKEKLGGKIFDVEKIVVPENSNFLLGFKVSEELKKGYVKMLPCERILKSQFWEGKFEPDEKIMIVHDVLVTGEQIKSSIQKFPVPTTTIGLFCLVNRVDHEGEQLLKDLGIKVYSILNIADTDIQQFVENQVVENGV